MSITTEASVRFYDHGDSHHATLTVGNENPTTQLTIIHESAEVTASEVRGVGCTEPIVVADGESLTLISRFNGQITGASILEVDAECADYGFLLSPRGGFNLIVYQDAILDKSELHHVIGTGEARRPLPPPGTVFVDVLEAL